MNQSGVVIAYLTTGLAALNGLGTPCVVLFLAVGFDRLGDGASGEEDSGDSTLGIPALSLDNLMIFMDLVVLGGLPLFRAIPVRGIKFRLILLGGRPLFLFTNPTCSQKNSI